MIVMIVAVCCQWIVVYTAYKRIRRSKESYNIAIKEIEVLQYEISNYRLSVKTKDIELRNLKIELEKNNNSLREMLGINRGF